MPVGQWPLRERKRRRAALKIVSQLYLAALFPPLLLTFGIPRGDLGLLVGAAASLCWFSIVPAVALNEVADWRHHAFAAGFGVIVTGCLKFLSFFPDDPMMGNVPLMFFLTLTARLVGSSFTHWCLAVPHRDIAARRRMSRALENYEGKGWRLVAAGFWFDITSVVMTLLFDVSEPLLLSVGAFGLGLILGVRPNEMVAVVWRAIVLFFTYEVPRTAEPHVYTFMNPFRDLRLRVLLGMLVAVSASIAICHWGQWPGRFPFGAFYTSDVLSFVLLMALWTIRLAVGGAFITIWTFAAFLVVTGPLCGFIYKGFAEPAVKEAEDE